MGGAMTPYVVRQGDYLAKLAFVLGFDADDVWGDPKNAELKALRPNPNLLAPGDILYVPEKGTPPALPIAKGSANAYSADIPKTTVRVAFKDANGPIANAPYRIDGLADPAEGSTDGSGVVEIDVPVDLRELRVTLTKLNVAYPVLVGDLDPIDEASGVRRRLEHLGYSAPDATLVPELLSEDDLEARARRAVAAYQTAKGMDATGLVDDAFKLALVGDHGC
jgi:hypothetical protein